MKAHQYQSGFTLVEIAIVLLIVGLLMRTVLEPIGIAQQQKRINSTRTELELVKDSLHAHLVAHGFLPCPIKTNALSLQRNDSAAGDECRVSQGGVPAVVLGLSGAIDAKGVLLDAWNRPYRYTVSLQNHSSMGNPRLPDWTTQGEASNVGLRYLSSDIVLCIQPSRASCTRKNVRAKHLAFVVLSHGQDNSSTGAQTENLDGDETFVVNALSTSQESPFDDQLVWSSAQDVMYWLLRAGWLP